jgi:copper(I)-binding protein
VEIHETIIENDVMRMRPVDALEIPAGESVEMAPGGLHLMLLDLADELVMGEAISVILSFEALAEVQTEPFEVVIGVPVLEEAPQNPPEIVVLGLWARPTAMAAMHNGHENDPDMIPPSAAYMTISNTGDEDRTIVSASSDLAGVVELHNTLMEDGVMRMFEMEDGVLLPAGETVELRPRGLHVMLMQLARDLVPGDALILALELDNGEVITLGVPVRDKMEMMPDPMSG